MSVVFLIKAPEGIREVFPVYPDNTVVKKIENRPSLHVQLLIKSRLSHSA